MITKIKQKNKVPAKQAGRPKLRFPGFSREWEEKRLGEVAEINPNTKHLPDEFIYIDLDSVEKGMLKQEKIISKLKAPSRAQRLLEKNDILFQMVRPYQKNNLFFNKSGNYVASTGYAQIRTKQSPIFLYQYLHTRNFLNKVLVRCTGTSYPAINSNDFKKIKIHLSSLPEQRKIASFLGAVDKRIEVLKKKREGLEKYKKGIMQKIFPAKGEKVPQIRFKDDSGKDFPEWEEKKLGEIGKPYNGLSGKTKNDFGNGSKFITYKQIFDDSKVDISKCGFVKISASEKQNKVQYGDLFFTTSSETPLEVGFSSVLLDKVSDIYLNSFCFGFRPKSLSIIDPNFAQFFFRSFWIRKKIVRLAQGSTRYNISKIQFLKIKVKFPIFPEQQKIASFLSVIDKKIELVDTQIQKMQEWKRGLMQGLFV